MCDALRRAKVLAQNVGVVASGVGWPSLWLERHVLIYGPRPDGKCQIDDLSKDDPVYYVTQLESTEAVEHLRNSGLEFYVVGNSPPERTEVAAQRDSGHAKCKPGHEGRGWPSGLAVAACGLREQPGSLDCGHGVRIQPRSRVGRGQRCVACGC